MIVPDILKLLREETGLFTYPFSAPAVEECLVYDLVPISDNGVRKESRLEIRIIAFSLKKAEQIDEQIRKLLLDIGDNNKIDGLSSIKITGGGTMQDLGTNTVHRFLFFNLIYRR